MADNSILTPGCLGTVNDPVSTPETDLYLVRDNFLSEYEKEEEKSVVRENLNVPSKDSVYTKQDVDTLVSEKIRNAILEYLNLDDPHGILPTVEEMIADMVKTDGSTPFTAPLTGVDPEMEYHLATKKYVDKLLREHLNSEDPHDILPEVLDILTKYAKTSDVYSKSLIYTKSEIDTSQKEYIRKDGTTPFLKAQIGVDPSIDSHLSTKRYVDKAIYNHIADIDPHGFITILNNRLASYIKKKDVYDKTQTYSRSLIDSIINKAVRDSIEYAIQDYQDQVNDKFEYIRKLDYVKQDGSTPFRNPLSGVDAVEESELVTLRQLKQTILDTKLEVNEQLCYWITSGPVESTVGHVEDNTQLPETMTIQEIFDAIFYGSGITLDVPKYVPINSTCPVTMCIHGSIGLVDHAELYLNGELIFVFGKEAFEEGCVTVDSLPITEDTEFTFKVYYTNGSVHEESKTVKCSLPAFIGLLPKWKFGNTITMEYLELLQLEDVEGTLNRFVSFGDDVTSISFDYSFEDAELRHPFIVLPVDYPDLTTMVTKSLSFGIEAFDVIDMIPLSVSGQDMIFKIYIYKQALSSLNLEVTFNFA